MSMRQRLKAMITSKHMVSGTAVASFAESTVVPIPLEAILIPAMQANRSRIWALATAALAGCLAGAAVGYAIGYFLFDAIGQTVLQWFGDQQTYESAKQELRNRGFWFVLSVGIAPVPFQIAMLAAGAIKYSIWGYIGATLIARGIRYYGLALLVWKFGNKAEHLFRKHKKTTATIILVIVAAAWGIAWYMK